MKLFWLISLQKQFMKFYLFSLTKQVSPWDPLHAIPSRRLGIKPYRNKKGL